VRTSAVYLTTVLLLFAIVSLPVILVSGAAQAADVTLAWNPNSEPDISGYRVYYGTNPGSYGQPINVGNITTATIPNLSDAATYYFAVTAYNTSGLESGFSNEVAKVSVTSMAASGSILYRDFGPSGVGYGGIWRWNGTTWTQIAQSNPEAMTASGSVLYADFGPGGVGYGGIWMWHGTSWNKLWGYP